MSTIKSDQKYIKSFVTTFHKFKDEKIEFRKIFEYYDTIEEKAIQEMLDINYHDLSKVSGIYKDALGVKFPHIGEIYKAVSKRHDCIHRNGKSKDGSVHNINYEEIEKLCKNVEEFIVYIDNEIKNLLSPPEVNNH